MHQTQKTIRNKKNTNKNHDKQKISQTKKQKTMRNKNDDKQKP